MRAQAFISLGFCLAVFLCPVAFGDPLDHWTLASNQLPPNVASIAYGDGKFVAVGSLGADGGWLSVSTDLEHWNAATCQDHLCAPPPLLGVTFANGWFIAVGNYGWTYTSTNALDWRLTVLPPSDSLLRDVCAAGDRFIAVGEMESCPCGVVTISLDGGDWNPINVEDIVYLRSVAFGKGMLVAVGLSDLGTGYSARNIIWSTNSFATWRATAANETNDLFAVAYGNDVFVAAGEEHYTRKGCILTSSDGQNWLAAALPVTNALRNVTFVQGTFLATGPAGTLFTSTNGTDWQLRPPFTTKALGRSIAVGGSILMFSAEGTLFKSDPLVSLQIGFGAQPELIVSGLEGRTYRIEATTRLGSQIWDEIGSFVLYSSPTLWRDGSPSGTARFYRAVLLP